MAVSPGGRPMDTTPFSTSTTSNWVARSGGLPDYVRGVAHALLRKGRAKSEAQAISMAVGLMQDWAAGRTPNGKGHVHPQVQAAAAAALAKWNAMKASAHAHANEDGAAMSLTWNGTDGIDLATVELGSYIAPHLPAGSPQGGQFGTTSGGGGKKTPAQKPTAHQAHVAHLKHLHGLHEAHIAHLQHLVATGKATPAQKAELARLTAKAKPAPKAKAATKPKAAAASTPKAKATAKPATTAKPAAKAAPAAKSPAKATPATTAAAATPKAAATAPNAPATPNAATPSAPATATTPNVPAKPQVAAKPKAAAVKPKATTKPTVNKAKGTVTATIGGKKVTMTLHQWHALHAAHVAHQKKVAAARATKLAGGDGRFLELAFAEVLAERVPPGRSEGGQFAPVAAQLSRHDTPDQAARVINAMEPVQRAVVRASILVPPGFSWGPNDRLTAAE